MQLLFVLFCAALCAAAWPSEARAQDPVSRPFRPIFGAVVERPNSRQALDVTATLQQAFGHDPALQESSWYPHAALDVQYRRQVKSLTFTASAGSTGQYYSQRGPRFDRSHNVGATLDMPVGPWTRIRLGQTGSYANFFTLSGLPGGALPDAAGVLPGQDLLAPAADFGMSSTTGHQRGSRISITQQLLPGGTLEARYDIGGAEVSGQRTTRREVGGRYRQGITDGLGIVAGYGVERARNGAGVAVEIRNIDLGVDYRRALSRSRNTTLAVTTGSAVVEQDGGREYRILGDARLIRLIGRSWSTSIGYNRGVEFMPVLGDVLASDAVTVTLDGFASRALQTSISASYSLGTLGVQNAGRLATTLGVARIEYGFARSVAVNAQYTFYAHELGSGPALLETLDPMTTQHRVRVGLNLWLPMFH